MKTGNKEVSEESWVSHLGFIQNVITRMAQNSYLLKGWTVTLVAAIFALSLTLKSAGFIAIALLPVLTFAVLDAFYLRQEQLFRKLYDNVRTNPQCIETFSMDTARYQEEGDFKEFIASIKLIKTISILPFYMVILVAVVIGIGLSLY